MQNGNSLIEVLISLILISLLLFGVESTILRAKQYQYLAKVIEKEWTTDLKKSEKYHIFRN